MWALLAETTETPMRSTMPERLSALPQTRETCPRGSRIPAGERRTHGRPELILPVLEFTWEAEFLSTTMERLTASED